MKYKPGDKVKIKSRNWFKANEYNGQGIDDVITFLEMIDDCCGKELTIDYISTDERGSGYIMKEPKNQWRFTDSMIEGLVEHHEKMVSLDDVCKFLDEHLYTDTSTGDYDYGQEYIRSDFNNASDLIFALRKKLEE